MNVRMQILAAAAALPLMVACASDVDPTTSTLRIVDEDAVTSQLLYMAPELSPYPMTEATLQREGIDVVDAIPVRIEVFDEVAVAWYAPGGEAIINMDNVIALWSVVDRQQTAGELDRTNPAEVGGVDAIVQTDATGVETELPMLDVGFDAQDAVDVRASAIIDFFDRVGTAEEAFMARRLREDHPGC